MPKPDPYADKPSFPRRSAIPDGMRSEHFPPSEGEGEVIAVTSSRRTYVEIPEEGSRWAEDQAYPMEARHASGGLSDSPDDGGPQATSSKPYSFD